MAKCRTCKVIIKPSVDDFIRLKKTFYYHTECYKTKELDNLVPIEIVEDIITNAKEEYRQFQEQKTKTYKGNSIQDGLDELVMWLQKEYDISFMPTNFYRKMASVANGSYKGLSEPVKYIDVLDMLQRRKKQLDRQLAGKKFDTNLYRFYYDLAVVLSKYDSYKAWKITQENNKHEILNDIQLQKRVEETRKITSRQVDNKNDNSIENMLDDIFD